jgi:hypothetical protein
MTPPSNTLKGTRKKCMPMAINKLPINMATALRTNSNKSAPEQGMSDDYMLVV